MTLGVLETVLAAVACLLFGAWVNRHVAFLERYNIPDPITGGLLFAVAASIASATVGFTISFDATLKPTLLLMFFAGCGMTADLRLLKQGGKALALFLLVLFPFVIIQNLTGLAVAAGLDMHPIFGLIVGSITLVGGPGTGAAYAERFAEVHNLQSAMELSMTSATMGLILGGIVTGPVAEFLIKRHKLRSQTPDAALAESSGGHPPITGTGLAGSLAGILAAVIIGQWCAARFTGLPIVIPSFLWCMIAGVAIRNLAPFARLEFDDRASELISGVSLGLFLVMTMMALNLVEVAATAGPLLVILAAQVVVICAYTIFVAFRFMGRDYEAAITSAALIGFCIGSTATAVAAMQAVTAKYGHAPTAFLIVPLAGAFFVDLMNAVILTVFMLFGALGG